MENLLKFKGSLLKDDFYISAPYDVSKKPPKGKFTGLKRESVLNYNSNNFIIDYTNIEKLNVINGMGVTLGDSIIGLSVLHAIKKINPDIKISVIRPSLAPLYVEEIYKMASNIVDEIIYMPYDIRELDKNSLNIDVGNQLYWPEFHSVEMHDFFMANLGLRNMEGFEKVLSNSWMKTINVPETSLKNYVVFSPLASTSIRSIPAEFHTDIVDMLYRRTGKNIKGFIDIEHHAYENVKKHSTSTSQFISIIKNADFVYTADSSALHIAAGFDVATECVFTTIQPKLRTKYYPLCQSHFIGNQTLINIQNSEEPELVKVVKKQFRSFFYD